MRLIFPSSLRPTRRKLGFVLGFLLLVLAAHLAVIEWLRHELPLVAMLDDDEDDSIVSITLQTPPEPREPPVMPKIKELPPPKAADKDMPVAAVPAPLAPTQLSSATAARVCKGGGGAAGRCRWR